MNDLIEIQKFEVEIQNASTIHSENLTSLTRAKNYGESLLEAYSKGINDNTYKAGLEYLAKVQKTVKAMNEKRKPITQMLNEIAKQFTVLEAELATTGDTIPAKVKARLDEYAAEIIRKRKEEEAKLEHARRRDQELIEFTSNIKTAMFNRYQEIVNDGIRLLSGIFKSATLENFDEVSATIMNATYPISIEMFDCSSIIKNTKGVYGLLTIDDFKQVCSKSIHDQFPEYQKMMNKRFDDLKQSYISEFDVKYQELQEIAKAGEIEAERLRQKAIEDERFRLAEQLAKLELERKAEETAIQNSKIASNITSLFDTAQPVNEVKVKEITEITVTNPAGWIELVLFYFENEGKTLSNDKLEKKFGFAKKFAESEYMKNDVKINSKFLNYVETAKAK